MINMYRTMFKLYKSTLFVLICGFFIGFMLGIMFIQTHRKGKTQLIIYKNKTRTAEFLFQSWLHSKGLERQCLPSEEVSYKNISATESHFLAKHVNVLCAVFVSSPRKIDTITSTWGPRCNKLIFFGYSDFSESKVPIYVIQPKSSWHYLCTAMRHIWQKNAKQLQWILFIPDNIFAIPENLRLVVASLDHNKPYYLGHALYLWGETYNAAQAGYVLSKATLWKIVSKFNSSEACEKSGKHWKNEDFFLGMFLVLDVKLKSCSQVTNCWTIDFCTRQMDGKLEMSAFLSTYMHVLS